MTPKGDKDARDAKDGHASHKEMAAQAHGIDVAALALLARLHVTPNEAQALTHQLDAILGYVDQLRAVPSVGAANEASQVPAVSLRLDTVVPSLPVSAVLQNAPEPIGDGFGVPKIIE